MKDVILRWTCIAVAALALGPAMALLTGVVRDVQGGSHATLVVSAGPIVSTLAGLAAILACAAYGVVVARVTTPGLGLFCAGAAIGWPAFTGALSDNLIRISQSAGVLWALSAEGLLVAGLGILGAMMILRPKRDDSSEDELVGSQAALGASVAFLVGVIVTWAIAREGTPGQILAAAGIGSIFGIAAGRSVAPSASMVVCVGAVLLGAVLGPAAGAILQGSDIVEATYANNLFPLARLTPLYWLAGAWMGAPIGGAWASSMLEKKIESTGGVARQA